MSFSNIIYTEKEKIATIQLNRPKFLNALCDELISEMNLCLENIEKNKNISVLVIKGNDKAFAAGADILEMSKKEYVDHINDDFIQPWEKLADFKKPCIACVSGYALGGGCEIAMMCDIIIASENAKFGQPEINLGTIPAAGGTQRLTKAVGKSKAMELVLSGGMIDANEAKFFGLVSKVVSQDSLETETYKIAEKIAEKSLPVLMLAKKSVLRAHETSLKEGNFFERKIFQSTFALEDRKEGMNAFLEKRKPFFKNK